MGGNRDRKGKESWGREEKGEEGDGKKKEKKRPQLMQI